MIKSMVAVVEDVDKASGLVDAVLTQAEYLGASVTFQILAPGPVVAPELAPFGSLYLPDTVLAAEAMERIAKLRSMVSKSSVAIEVLGLHDDVAWLAGDMRKSRPIADISLLGSVETWTIPWLHRRVAETLALASGTPLLILPPGRSVTRINHAVLGWKSSAEAVRALHDLIAIANPGARIDVVSAGSQPSSDLEDDPHKRVIRYLEHLGFQAEARHIDDGSDAAQQLQVHALEQGADLLASGAFAHSRLREVVFGSVTERLITDTRLPVLLSH